MSLYALERDNLSTSTSSAEIQPLQTPDNVIFFNPRLIEFTGNLHTNIDSQKTGWDSSKEIKRFIGDINLGLIKGLTPEQAVAFSIRILTDHIRFYNAEFIRQEPVLPHRNYLGVWQGRERWLGNNGRPVVDMVDEQERTGSVKQAAKKIEECLLEAENNSFIVSMSAQGPSGYFDENSCDNPHLNTLIMVDLKDANGNLKGITLVTDLTIDQAEKVMKDIGTPTNIFAERGTEMQRVVNLLENPAMPSLPEAYHNPLEYVFDRVLAVRGVGDVRIRQKSGQDEIWPVAEVKQKIAAFESLLDLNGTTDRLVKEFEEFVLSNYQNVKSPSFQQEIIDMAEETILLFTKYYRKHNQNNLSADYLVVLPQRNEQYAVDDREIVRSQDRRSMSEDFRQEIAFLQSRAGCPGSRQSLAGKSGVAGVPIFSESDSMGSLYFSCPVCGAVNKRPWEGYVDNCQSCGTDKVSCSSPGAKQEKQEESSNIIAFPGSTSKELPKAA